MDFVAILIIFPVIIAILSLVVVYNFGVIGIVICSISISLYYTFALNGVRNWNPNGVVRKTPVERVLKNLALSSFMSFVVLYIFHYIFK